MSTSLLTFRPAGIRFSAVAGNPTPDSNRRKNASSPKWWAPIFGLSSDPDYFDSNAKEMKINGSDLDLDQKPATRRFNPGGFTEEKARQLRMMTNKTSAFHDAMYHSAIASRLASEFDPQSDL